jgi:predicted transcriptional regulator
MSEIVPTNQINTNLPVLTNASSFDEEDISNLTSFAYLTQPRRIVLVKMIEAMTTDLVYTDTEIAEKSGVSVQTVKNCRQNAYFLDCLSQATKQFTKSKVPKYIKLLEKTAEKGSVRAIDLLIRYTGDFIPTNRNENLNATIQTKASQNMNLDEAITEFVAQLADKGKNLQQIHEAVDKAYLSLRDQQRIA